MKILMLTCAAAVMAAPLASLYARPPAPQHVICCKQLIDVGGSWFGALRTCNETIGQSPEMRAKVCAALRENNSICPEVEDLCEEESNGPSCKLGSLIEVEDQVLRESLAVAGTPFALNYSSALARAGRLSGEHLSRETLGGWTLSPRHIYDPVSGVLYLGDGSRLNGIRPARPAGAGSDIEIADETASEVYVFDGSGRHVRTLDGLTRAIQYTLTYDDRGRLSEIAEVGGRITRITRDSAGRRMAIATSTGYRTDFVLNAEGYLAAVTNPAGEATKLEYAAGGRLSRLVNPLGQVSVFTFDANGHLVTDQDAAGGTQSLTRKRLARRRELLHATALGRVSNYILSADRKTRTHRLPSGAERIESRSGTARRITYPDGTLLEVAEAPDPRWPESAYVSSAVMKTPAGITRTLKQSRQQEATRFVAAIDVNGRTSRAEYDAGRKQLVETTPAGRRSETTFDAAGRVAAHRTGGLSVEFTYDRQGRLAESRASAGSMQRRLAALTYDPAGQIASHTDWLGRAAKFEYDAAGRLLKQVLADGTTLAWTRDALGRVRSFVAPGGVTHTFDYTPIGLFAASRAAGQPPKEVQYDYNHDRQLTAVKWGGRNVLTLGYDGGGRLDTLAHASSTIRLSYVERTDRLKSIGDMDQGISFDYDGPLLTAQTWEGVVNGTVKVSYNSSFQIRAISLPDVTIDQEYDADGLPARAGRLIITRDAASGAISKTQLDRVTTEAAYNAFGEAVSFTARAAETPLLSFQIERDPFGRVAGVIETLEGATSRYGYRYDARGRISEVVKDGTNAARYEYDANGNRILATVGAETGRASYEDGERLAKSGQAAYAYDAGGQVASRIDSSGTATFSYDPTGVLRGVRLADGKRIDYVIDGLGRRVGRKVDDRATNAWLYLDELKPIAELDGAGRLVTAFVYGHRRNAPEYMLRGGRTYRLLSDMIGSVRLIVDADTGAIAQRLDYDAFGRVIRDTKPGFQPFGFAGGLYDPLTGLTRFGARDYDAATGRWTAPDPLGFSAGFNRYVYAGNDPLNRIDIYGTQDEAVTWPDIQSRADVYIERVQRDFFSDVWRGTPPPPSAGNPGTAPYRPPPPPKWQSYIFPGPDGFPESDGYNVYSGRNAGCSLTGMPTHDGRRQNPDDPGVQHRPGRTGDPTTGPPPSPKGGGVSWRFGTRR